MNPVATNCHACHLEGRTTPAQWSTKDDEFYCDTCIVSEGLRVTDLISIRRWKAKHGIVEPRPEPGLDLEEMPGPAPVRHIEVTEVQATEAEPEPKKVCNPKSSWRGYATLGINQSIATKEPTKEENETMPDEGTAHWCSKCGKIKVKPTSKTGLCTPCMCGFSATNPKRLALEAKSAGREPEAAVASKKKAPKRAAATSTLIPPLHAGVQYA
jgi:hypothetical protein